MLHTITFLEKHYKLLQQHLFKDGKEQAAYLLCSLSKTDNEARFIVNEVIPVEDTHIEANSSIRIHYTYESYVPVISKAKNNNQCFIMVHCHPGGFAEFSETDDIEEPKLLEYAYKRIGDKLHGSLVFTDDKNYVGRVYNTNSQDFTDISKIRVIGDNYKFINASNNPTKTIDADVYNRNILAFGEGLQKALQQMNIGVIGCGGNGSAVIEQLCRLGVGKITMVDHDIFEATNVTRIHGSSMADEGKFKVALMGEMIKSIGLNTQVVPLKEKLDNKETAKKLRDCDLIFCCLDFTHFARAILNQICLYYYIPIIDMGIKFDSRNGILNDVAGRIDVITPNTSCLFCRGEINFNMIKAEQMSEEEYLRLKAEGYAPELKTDKVQAIPYNTLIATYAITEMIQMLYNIKGKTSYHNEYMFMKNKCFNSGIMGEKMDSSCSCTNEQILGKGDTEPFLYMNW